MPCAERPRCYIREDFQLIPQRNIVSGHQWFAHGPTTTWLIVGPTGVCGRHRTEKGADKELIEWQAFFDRQYEMRKGFQAAARRKKQLTVES